jgi:RNA polymerase sigma factor (sigma-70 family)
MANELRLRAETSDKELLRRAGREPDAFRDFYERYSEEILGYFRRRKADRDTALELTAETFSRAWVMRERFEDRYEGSAAPWLFGIARNVLLMSIRRGAVERRTAARLGVLERLDLDGSSEAAPETGWADGADELLDSLPLSQREALRLRVVDELTYDEVADALGTTRSAARVRVHRALTALRKRFSNKEEQR